MLCTAVAATLNYDAARDTSRAPLLGCKLGALNIILPALRVATLKVRMVPMNAVPGGGIQQEDSRRGGGTCEESPPCLLVFWSTWPPGNGKGPSLASIIPLRMECEAWEGQSSVRCGARVGNSVYSRSLLLAVVDLSAG